MSTFRHRVESVPRSGAGAPAQAARDRSALAVRPGGPAERFAVALGLQHPALTFGAALLVGLAALAAASVLMGLFVLHVLLDGLGLGSADGSVNTALADHRTATLTDISAVGSFLGGAPLLPILVALVALGCAVARRWLVAAFAVFVLATESATYRITTLVIHRDRPAVARLDKLPVDASFPSGHTAASVAVYAGLVFLLASRLASSRSRALAWTFAILMATFVALSRLYRGMHHPLDVVGGAIIGMGAIAVLLFACRAAAAAVAARHPRGARA